MKEEASKTKSSLYRSCRDTVVGRYRRKLTAKTNWIKRKRPARVQGPTTIIKDPDEVEWETPRKPRRPVIAAANTTEPEKEKGDDDPLAVLFVPHTEGGVLIQRLREDEATMRKISGYGIKLVERPGSSLKNPLWSADPWGGLRYEDQGCVVCTSEPKKTNV